MHMLPLELKRIRLELELTQEELGDKLGYGMGAQQRISELENGRTLITRKTALFLIQLRKEILNDY